MLWEGWISSQQEGHRADSEGEEGASWVVTGEGTHLLSPVSPARPLIAGAETQGQVSQKELWFTGVKGRCDLCVLGREDIGERLSGCGLPGPRGLVSGTPSLPCLLALSGSEPVHELPDSWGSLCPLSGGLSRGHPVFPMGGARQEVERCTGTPERAGARGPLGEAWGQSRHVGGAQRVCGMEIRLLLHLLWQSQVPVLFPVPCLCVSMSPPGGHEETCGQCEGCTWGADQGSGGWELTLSPTRGGL